MAHLHWIALSKIDEIGPAKFRKLVKFFGDPESIFKASQEELIKTSIIKPETAEKLLSRDHLRESEAVLRWCDQFQIRCITLDSSNYPKLLKEIYDPPYLLYCMGDVELLNTESVAIVGTRNITDYGRRATEKITSALTKRGITIVSGLAYGVDREAHQSSLNGNGKTVAVLATGLDKIYPASHRSLAKEIIQKDGAIITETPPSSDIQPFRFLQRNRIISGLCRATVVVEAAEKSGALSTATQAISQNRELFAMPGPIDSELSRGPNNLILQGAIPALSGEQIYSHLFPNTKTDDIEKTADLKQVVDKAPKITQKLDLDGDESLIYSYLMESGGARMDQLLEQFTTIVNLFQILLSLEMDGHIIQAPGQIYRVVN